MVASGETRVEYVPAVGRRARLGNWQDQKISTYRKIREAIEQGRWDDAAELGNYFVDEAKVCFAIYRQWIPDLKGFLTENGVLPAEIERANAEIVSKLDLPDGRPGGGRASGRCAGTGARARRRAWSRPTTGLWGRKSTRGPTTRRVCATTAPTASA